MAKATRPAVMVVRFRMDELSVAGAELDLPDQVQIEVGTTVAPAEGRSSSYRR